MSIKLRKVAIVGVGHVGSHVAFSIATQGLADEIYMVDIDAPKALAQTLDINDAVSYYPHQVKAIASPLEECGDCDIMFISAGPLPADMTDRLDSLGASIEVCKDIIPKIKKSGFNGIIVSITNPADVIVTYLQKELNYPTNKIISTGTALDSARIQRIVSDALGVGRKGLQVYAMGEHGNSAMVPWSQANIMGRSLTDVQKDLPHRFPDFDRAEAAKAMVASAFDILRGKGSTEFGIGTSAAEVARIIFHDEKKMLPCSCYLSGQFGEEGIFASVPAILGKDGVEAIIEVELPEEELALFKKSCAIIREHVAKAYTL